MTNVKEMVSYFNKWYDGLKKHSRNFPAKGTIAGALVILERLKEEFTLDIEAHTAKGGSQIKGASGEAVKGILERFGEKRPFVAEGGRTNRGLRGDIKKMLDSLRDSKISGLTGTERNDILSTLQRILVEKVKEFHSQERLKIVYDPSKSTRQLIHEILESAKEHEKYGPIAQYLVGAKLQLRFPDEEIRNDSYSTADQKQKKPGDFSIEDTIFHVTVSPMEMVFDKCRANLAEGFRVYILVPEEKLDWARQFEKEITNGTIAVESIESFVSQNLEELSFFSKKQLSEGLRQLVELYNKRVNIVEIDKSMMIDLPNNV